MDPSFEAPAMAIITADLDGLRSLLRDDPELAAKRSSVGHPTLLQLVACEAANLPDAVGAAGVLADAGAPLDDPLIAAAGCNAASVVDLLLDRGADIDTGTHWTALDEALYWGNREMAEHLLARGAAVRALSTAAGLGEVTRLETFVEDGRLVDSAGPIGSPFADTVPAALADDPQSILDHAFVMAVNGGHQAAAEFLLGLGAEVNAMPPGYHWHGTALHAACWRGDAELVAWLCALGADPSIRDGLVDADAAAWATHHGHPELLPILGPDATR